MIEVCPRRPRSQPRPSRYSWSADISAAVGSPRTGRSSLALVAASVQQVNNKTVRNKNFK